LIRATSLEKKFGIRYYGCNSNRIRGDRLKADMEKKDEHLQLETSDEIEVLDVSRYRTPARRIPSPTWHECIKKIWEVDPLECPMWHGEMKIIRFITGKSVIRKIPGHPGHLAERAAAASQ